MTERYAELHAHSGFSFLDGASDPEELVAEAHRLGLEALADEAGQRFIIFRNQNSHNVNRP